jgi:integrase
MSVALGQDPSADRHSRRNSTTLSELCDDYLADMISGRIPNKKMSTIKSDKSRIENHIRVQLGRFKVATITTEQIEEFVHGVSKGSAKRMLGLLGAIFSYGIKKKFRTTNPAHGIEKPSDVRKTRRLSETEYIQLGTALNGGATLHDVATSIFSVLAISGWRSSEARLLKWSELDIDRKIATLENTKSGMSVRPLSDSAINIIKRQANNGGAYVFQSHNTGKPISNLTPYWRKLGMSPDITQHTMRHSLASLAGDLGLADSTIAGLLGHARTSITSRYIHLDKSLITAADSVAAETLRLMQA